MYIPQDMLDEGFRWLNNNREGTCSPKQFYGVPRVSSEYMDCSMPLTMDSYNYCSFACNYCFSYYFRSTNPTLNTEEGRKLKPVNYERFEKLLTGKLPDVPAWKHFFSKRYILQWGSMGEPFDFFEKQNRVGEKLIKLFGDINYPVKLCFKGSVIEDYWDLFEKYKHQHNFAFQSSIINTNDKLAESIEMGVPSPTKRFEYLKRLSDMGYYTIVRLRPFMIGMSDITLDDFLEKVKKYNINAISLEFFCLDVRANDNIKKRYKWMSDMLGYDIMDYYKELSPFVRGGYRRLNRDVKERFVRKIYKFCYDNNVLFACSDPDFKELNWSGSCCGLPNEFKPNPEITNYCNCQLTNAIRLMRKDYWSGNKRELHLYDIYGLDNKFGSYFDDLEFFSQDVVEKIVLSSGYASTYTMRIAMKKHWNNLRSPKCPVNYFDGKIKPTGKDKFGDIVFEYVPSQYEYMWRDKYGIDLGKY